MNIFLVCASLWIIAIWGETSLFPHFSWMAPNLFSIFPTLLIIRWRGYETFFISCLFGLTADCFATTPFGLYGLAFFIISFIIRWLAVKLLLESPLGVGIICGITVFFSDLAAGNLYYIFQGREPFSYLNIGIVYQVLSSAILAVPLFIALTQVDKKLKIRLSERKF